jgi:hypothetical protein
MYNVQKNNIRINVQSSQTFKILIFICFNIVGRLLLADVLCAKTKMSQVKFIDFGCHLPKILPEYVTFLFRMSSEIALPDVCFQMFIAI